MTASVEPSFDYVIVGAGSAGCVLANRLSCDPAVSVCLIEAGGSDARPSVHIPIGYAYNLDSPKTTWQFRTAPDPGINGRSLPYPRGKIVGGTSSINGMVYHRGQASDYDAWRDAGNRGWGWSDVLPYFKKSEDHSSGEDTSHGVGGPFRVEEPRVGWPILDAFYRASAEFGLPENRDFNSGDNSGVGRVQVNQRRGLRESAATAFLRPAQRRRNLTVLTKTQVLRVVFHDRRASGVEVQTSHGTRHVAARVEVILCAGAVGSPHLLMLSGVGDAAMLREHDIHPIHHLAAVGRNLQEHLTVRMAFRVHGTKTLNDQYRSWLSKIKAGFDFALLRRGILTMPPSTVNAFIKSSPSLDASDIQLLAMPMTYAAPGQPPDRMSGFSVNVLLLRPKSRGEVSLTSNNPLDHPSIQFRFMSASGDREAVVAGMQSVRSICASEALAKFHPEEIRPGPQAQSHSELGAQVSELGQTSCHAVGTCRMGNDEDAVVDDRLRVHGLEGLRVVDASIMPLIVSGNTNAATMMIAEKGADLVLSDLHKQRSARP